MPAASCIVFSVVSTLDIRDGYRDQNEFFRRLLETGHDHLSYLTSNPQPATRNS